MPYKKSILLLLIFFGCLNSMLAQDSMDLKQCIEYAWKNSINIQQSQLNVMQQNKNLLQTKASALPSLNAGANQNYNFGRTIDPATNQFANQHNRTNYFSLQSDMVLFNGLRRLNLIRQAKWAEEAAENNFEKSKEDAALTVANMYLQVLLLKERENQLKNQLEASEEQEKKSKILFNSGAITKTKSLEADAQLATDEANLIDVQNQLTTALLNLKQFINYDISKPLLIKNVNIDADRNLYTDTDLSDALNNKVNNQPAVLAAESNSKSALYNWKAAQGNYYPRIVASAALHSVYSSLNKDFTYNYFYGPIGFLARDSSQVYGPQMKVESGNTVSFQEQLKNNFGQSLGFQINIPIFNGLQTSYAVQSAKISYLSAQLNLKDVKTQAKNNVYQAYESMKMYEKKYIAAQSRFEQQNTLFEMVGIQYKGGAADYFQYNAQRIMFDNAQIDLLQAKYQFVFQKKVFEYYIGKPITF